MVRGVGFISHQKFFGSVFIFCQKKFELPHPPLAHFRIDVSETVLNRNPSTPFPLADKTVDRKPMHLHSPRRKRKKNLEKNKKKHDPQNDLEDKDDENPEFIKQKSKKIFKKQQNKKNNKTAKQQNP